MLAEPHKSIYQIMIVIFACYLADWCTWFWLFLMEGKFVSFPAIIIGGLSFLIVRRIDG